MAKKSKRRTRIRRLKYNDPREGYYHVISHINSPEHYFDDEAKEKFISLLGKLSRTYFVRLLSYSVFDDHFHLFFQMIHPTEISRKELKKRFDEYYYDEMLERVLKDYIEYEEPYYYDHFGDMSKYIWNLKRFFTTWYNLDRLHTGPFWRPRFQSTMFVGLDALRAGLLYVDVHAVRNGLVREAETYPYSSLYAYMNGTSESEWLDMTLLKEALTYDGSMPKGSSDKELLEHYLDVVYREGLGLENGKKSLPNSFWKNDSIPLENEIPTRIFLAPIPQFIKGYFIGPSDVCAQMFLEYNRAFRTSKPRQGSPIFQPPKKGMPNVLPPCLRNLYSIKKRSLPYPL